MADLIDGTLPPREGEALDPAAVGKYLKEKVPGLTGEATIEQFPSGHSNLTYLVRVGERELVLRRPPFGSKVKAAHDMGREFRILSAIHPVYPPAPRPLAFCEDESVMAAKFYVMDRIRGVILRREVPAGLDFSPETTRRLSFSLIENLARIHAIDYRAVGLGDLGRPEGFLARQVKGWTDRYSGSKTDEIEGLNQLTQWLLDNVPPSPPATLIHNDYKLDNIILDANDITNIIGVLDWEMSTIGDPIMDLGVALGYWIQEDDPDDLKTAAFGPTRAPGFLTRKQLADHYSKLTGRDVSAMPYHLTFALFKLAVILQQIYYRFNQGLTRDPRFGPMIDMVKKLIGFAREQMGRDEI